MHLQQSDWRGNTDYFYVVLSHSVNGTPIPRGPSCDARFRCACGARTLPRESSADHRSDAHGGPLRGKQARPGCRRPSGSFVMRECFLHDPELRRGVDGGADRPAELAVLLSLGGAGGSGARAATWVKAQKFHQQKSTRWKAGCVPWRGAHLEIGVVVKTKRVVLAKSAASRRGLRHDPHHPRVKPTSYTRRREFSWLSGRSTPGLGSKRWAPRMCRATTHSACTASCILDASCYRRTPHLAHRACAHARCFGIHFSCRNLPIRAKRAGTAGDTCVGSRWYRARMPGTTRAAL